MFIKYDGRELEYGVKIRLAGREGSTAGSDKDFYGVFWENKEEDWLEFKKFPDLEIWIEAPKISKAAAEELKKWAASITLTNGPLYHLLLEKIDSMTE